MQLPQYEYKLHTYCGECILIAMQEDSHDDEGVEQTLNRLATERDIDRADTHAFSMMDFPKQTNTPIEDSCALCGKQLMIGEMI